MADGMNLMAATRSWSGRSAVTFRSTGSAVPGGGPRRAASSPRAAAARAGARRPGLAHQPGDPLAPVPPTPGPELGVDARRAMGLPRAGVDAVRIRRSGAASAWA